MEENMGNNKESAPNPHHMKTQKNGANTSVTSFCRSEGAGAAGPPPPAAPELPPARLVLLLLPVSCAPCAAAAFCWAFFFFFLAAFAFSTLADQARRLVLRVGIF